MILSFSLLWLSSSPAIINGTPVPANSDAAKFSVIVRHGTRLCSGVLIAPDLVVTAAHCISDEKMFVYFGNFLGDQWKPELTVYVKTTVRAPNANINTPVKNMHDIALIKLQAHAPEGFVPIAILDSTSELRPGTVATIAGFGRTQGYGDKRETKGRFLLSYEYKIAEQYETDSMIKFNDEQGGMAAGDSGGPAFISKNGISYLIGVGSNYKETLPAYESVPRFSAWIRETAAALGSEIQQP